MSAELAQHIIELAGLYLLAGLVFGLIFVTLLIKRFDPNAREAAPVQFRVLILPGVIVLWPILLVIFFKRLLVGGEPA